MELGPIWRAMMRNKTGAILIALQIAVTMAIIVNAVSIIQERARLIARPSGLDEHNIFTISSIGFAPDFNERVTIEEDLAALRAMPGVVDAIQSIAIPLSGSGWSMGLQTKPGAEIDATSVAVYFVDEHGLNTLRTESAGRGKLQGHRRQLARKVRNALARQDHHYARHGRSLVPGRPGQRAGQDRLHPVTMNR